MTLDGKAAIVIWNDVTPGARAAFVAWHNREHMPERIAIAGFNRGRRCFSADARGPEFLTLYEVSDTAVLNGPPYRARLDAPTAWTRRMLPQFRNTARSLCRVELSIGAGIGGFMASVRFPGALRADGEARRLFRDHATQLMRTSAELAGVHLLARESGASGQETAETRLRREAVAMPATVLLAEGTASDAVSAAAADLAGRLVRLGLADGEAAIADTYRHELCMRAGEEGPPPLDDKAG